MKFAAPLRREIGIRTVFNILGPLTNPAGAKTQVLGAPSPAAQERLAGALERLGVERALVVHGLDGLDEVSVTGPTRVYDVQSAGAQRFEIRPEDFGLRSATPDAVRGGDAQENAAIVRRILGGANGNDGGASDAQRDIVVLNAAAALVAAGRSADIADGVRLASDVVRSGEALARLDAFVRLSSSLGSN
jgi:anthranilate phosphoribosyltransferase